MEFVLGSITDGIAEVRLKRGKVNALSEPAIEEIADCLRSLAADLDTRAVILTGDGAFFSFGFDIPEFLGYSRESFAEFLNSFTRLYSYLFTYPNPVVAALNGHVIAGGCMLGPGLRLPNHGLGKGKNLLKRNRLWLISICSNAQVPGWRKKCPGDSLRRNDVLDRDGGATGHDRQRFVYWEPNERRSRTGTAHGGKRCSRFSQY